MGIEQPRLLSVAERDALGEELAALTPTERLVRIVDLKGRYGDRFAALARELAGAVSPDTEILIARLDDPPLAGVLARGMERDGVEFKGARHLWLPLIDGRLHKSRLEDKQLYQFRLGNRILSVVYDRKADALVRGKDQSTMPGSGTSRRALSRRGFRLGADHDKGDA